MERNIFLKNIDKLSHINELAYIFDKIDFRKLDDNELFYKFSSSFNHLQTTSMINIFQKYREASTNKLILKSLSGEAIAHLLNENLVFINDLHNNKNFKNSRAFGWALITGIQNHIYKDKMLSILESIDNDLEKHFIDGWITNAFMVLDEEELIENKALLMKILNINPDDEIFKLHTDFYIDGSSLSKMMKVFNIKFFNEKKSDLIDFLLRNIRETTINKNMLSLFDDSPIYLFLGKLLDKVGNGDLQAINFLNDNPEIFYKSILGIRDRFYLMTQLHTLGIRRAYEDKILDFNLLKDNELKSLSEISPLAYGELNESKAVFITQENVKVENKKSNF